jgi:lipoprotein-releasing system permease protein
MYKYLLCWRYLRTRYIALASIVSVMLGVATMIVVNAVMAGFSEKMRERLHGVQADVVVGSRSLDGFESPQAVMDLIRRRAGDRVEAMALTSEIYALLNFSYRGELFTREVLLIGIRPEERAKTGDFAEFVVDEDGNRLSPPSFAITDELRRRNPRGRVLDQIEPDEPFAAALQEEMQQDQPAFGAIVGAALASVHVPGREKDEYIVPRGSEVILTFPTGGRKPDAAHDTFTVVGYFKSGMSEYDSKHVYIPLERLQRLRLLGDGHGHGKVNQIQIKAKPGTDLDQLALDLQVALEQVRPFQFLVETWEQRQGPLLAAVAVEQSILNILLFFIIAVAGFGILAIFAMIVVEKTRDIGILKALGASTAGVRGIFLGYGLSLGLVGSGVGMLGGLAFVWKINWVEKQLSWLTGRKVFDDTIYYFNEIPTRVDPWTVAWIVGGALFIAVAASVWPAQRAASLHPVRALRYE